MGVEPDVNDPEIIEAAVQRRMDQLDQYALSSDRTTREQIQKLMNEVAKARVKLVERAEARAKKAKPVEAPKPEPMPVLIPVEPDQAPAKPVQVLEPTESTAEPSPVAANEQTPALRKPSFQFKFKFAMPRLSAEAWSLMGVAWLMSLAVAAVGAYFIASSQAPPTELASQVPAEQPPVPDVEPDEIDPVSDQDPDPALDSEPETETEPDTSPDTETATAPVNEQEAAPADLAAADRQLDAIMQITDPQARLNLYRQIRDRMPAYSPEQIAFIIEATRRFNGSNDLRIKIYRSGDGYSISAPVPHGQDKHPNLALTDISAFAGLETDYFNIQNCRAIKDFTILKTMRNRVLLIDGCVGLKDLTLLNECKGIEALYIGGSSVTSLKGLSIDGLKMLRISEAPVTDLSPLAQMELTQLHLANCYRLASLAGIESMPPLHEFRVYDEPDGWLRREFERIESIRPSAHPLYTTRRDRPNSVWPRVGSQIEPDGPIVHSHIAEHNKLDKITDAAYRHRAFIKLRDSQEPFSEAQIDLISRELKHVNKARDVTFDMQDDPAESKVTVGMVNGQIGSLNRAITDLSPLEGIKTHTLSVQHLTNLRDFDFLKGMTVDTLDLTGCGQFKDVSILNEVKGLSVLKLDKTGVSDLKKLQIDSLKTLSLVGCKGLRDLDGLQGMQLEALSAAGCTSLRDISALAPVRGLKLLNLDQTAIQSALPIAGQKGLKFLSLKGCEKLTTVSGLNRLVGLEHLYLHDTPSLDHVDVDRLQKLLRETNVSFKDEDIAYKPDDKPKPAPTDQPAPLSFDQIKQIQDKEARQTEYLKLRDSLEPYSREQALLIRDALFAFNDAKNVRIRITTNNKDAFTLVNTEKDKNSLRSPLRAITDLSMLEGLTFEALDLSGLSALNDFSVLSKITVKELSLRYCGALDRFDDLNDIDGLESLDVSNTSIRSLDSFDIETLDTLMISGNRQLTSLDGLDGSTIRYLQAEGIRSLTDISALRAVRGLKWLDLSGSNISSTGDLTGQSLTQIDLRDCSNLYALSGLETMRSLRKLDITATPRLSERYVEYLESSNNNLKVTR